METAADNFADEPAILHHCYHWVRIVIYKNAGKVVGNMRHDALWMCNFLTYPLVWDVGSFVFAAVAPAAAGQPRGLEFLFGLGGDVVLPGWLLLVIMPTWKWTQRYATFAVPLVLAATYGWLLLNGHPPPGAGFRSLAAVRLLFSAPEALLAGWLHYLAFDLFTGAWEARDAAEWRISRWIVTPCLVLTFLFGPLGLAAYLLIRVAMRKRVEA